jgi:hypothetical protein
VGFFFSLVLSSHVVGKASISDLPSATPRKKRQAIKPPQLKAVAWIVAMNPQRKTQNAHHLCGGNCFQPMHVHLELAIVSKN